MDKTPNLGLNRYTFKDLADMRKVTEDNDTLDMQWPTKADKDSVYTKEEADKVSSSKQDLYGSPLVYYLDTRNPNNGSGTLDEPFNDILVLLKDLNNRVSVGSRVIIHLAEGEQVCMGVLEWEHRTPLYLFGHSSGNTTLLIDGAKDCLINVEAFANVYIYNLYIRHKDTQRYSGIAVRELGSIRFSKVTYLATTEEMGISAKANSSVLLDNSSVIGVAADAGIYLATGATLAITGTCRVGAGYHRGIVANDTLLIIPQLTIQSEIPVTENGKAQVWR